MTRLKFRLNLAGVAALAALVILGFIALPALAKTSVSVNLNIGGPGVEWNQPPPMIVVPGTEISWVQDYSDADVYEYRSLWYCYRGGNWYRSSGYRGPWAVVSRGMVPYEIGSAPRGYRHFGHGAAAGFARGHGRSGGHPGNPMGEQGRGRGRGMPGNPGGDAPRGNPDNPGKPNAAHGPGNSGHDGGQGHRGNPDMHGSRGQGGSKSGGDEDHR